MLHDPQAKSDSMSPSLQSGRGTANAYELKFLLETELAERVERWASQHLQLDPHADSGLAGAYRIHSLYLDTPTLDIFRRTPTFGRRKFRLRRYGNEPGLYLEQKAKSELRVRKRRTQVADADLERLWAAAADPAWSGSWFHRRLLMRRLQPTCQITYDRVAMIGASVEGPVRLTLDRRILAAPTHAWEIREPTDGIQLIPSLVVLELKYRAFVPNLFKKLIQEFNLNPRPASKYRMAVETWGEQLGLSQSLSEKGSVPLVVQN